jgi:hypothetical protein
MSCSVYLKLVFAHLLLEVQQDDVDEVGVSAGRGLEQRRGPFAQRQQQRHLQLAAGLVLQDLRSYKHTYHSRFIPKGVAEASQILLRDAHVLPKLLSCVILYSPLVYLRCKWC